ncbi:MAG TPA: hypothetical protein DCM86_04085 [Verrucomicrobiales bacterium]|nr:hypothetical protein [Verrucomicrobiales bacterium]
MTKTTLQTKVGLFVVICLALLALLILNFSKGASLFRHRYPISLRTGDVGGIKQQAAVLLGGLRVGSVSELALAPDGKTVLLRLRIDSRYPLRQDARFVIEQSGFLGDQHVAIYPQSTTAPFLEPGSEVQCEQPFNLQEAARSATGFIQKIDQTAQRLNEVIQRVDRLVLNESTLGDVNQTVANFRHMSERTLSLADRLDTLLATNAPLLSGSMSNLNRFSESMNLLGTNLNATLAENRASVGDALRHLEAASRSLEAITRDVNAGQGLAGSLLRDAEVRESLRQTLANMSILSSNLSKYGLLYKPRPPKKESSTPKAGAGGLLQ